MFWVFLEVLVKQRSSNNEPSAGTRSFLSPKAWGLPPHPPSLSQWHGYYLGHLISSNKIDLSFQPMLECLCQAMGTIEFRCILTIFPFDGGHSHSGCFFDARDNKDPFIVTSNREEHSHMHNVRQEEMAGLRMCHANANMHGEWKHNYMCLDNNKQQVRTVWWILIELFKCAFLLSSSWFITCYIKKRQEKQWDSSSKLSMKMNDWALVHH